MIILIILCILLGVASLFVYWEHLRIKKLSNDYYISSTCLLYNSSYGVWSAYNEYNGHGQECLQKSTNELEIGMNIQHGILS